MFLFFPIILAFFTVSNAQQLLDLKSFKGGVDSRIGATGPYAIYVSASSDSTDTLKQVYVKTSDNQIKSLYDLKNNKFYQNSGLLQPFKVDTEAFVSTLLNDEQMNSLKGFMYITTAQQLANSDGFYVYDVTVSEKIQFGPIQPDNCTLVFLNSNFDTNPWQSSTVSSWVQSDDSSVHIYEGIPKDTEEKKSSHIFSNPVMATKDAVFIPNVEKFSLNLGAFYFKTFKEVQFVIEPMNTNIDGSYTTAMTTTGFYMKPFNAADTNVTIQTARDSRFNGTTGGNVVGSVPVKATVTLAESPFCGPISAVGITPSGQIQGWSIAAIGDTYQILSTDAQAGEFFVQYYIIQGSQISSTTLPGRQTTAGPIQTTTKSSIAVQFLTSILVPMLGARYL